MTFKKLGTWVFVVFSLLIGSAVWAEAGRYDIDSHQGSGPGLIYMDKAFNNAIHSYLSLESVVVEARNPQIIYVNKAYGQSVYSYPRVGPDTVTAFNVEYVSPAYGQAIYSYPGNYDFQGQVVLLPLMVDKP
ncbi:hypothetical protein [Methylocaldum sp.]|uniref:hypothetical protein n=1 Tax=Methylocaldum sp. TaxID=1969727 RepID=UPI002D4DF9A7|nr:hypothetical protein [Methylocaldum sp.]HYE37715.1 hypothetical protein [Methylocaldum sp.]